MEEKEAGLSAAGWIFLVLSWGTVAAFVCYCFYKVLFKK